jgi:hypothetical protein
MSSTDQLSASNNFDNEWGFYVDLESLPPVLQGPSIPQRKREYNYEYFAEHYDDFEDDYDGYYNTYVPHSASTHKFIPENVEGLIVRISSTTIITVALTYVIFFVL